MSQGLKRSNDRKATSWAWYYLGLLVLVAVFANWLANDRPWVASYEGQTYWPILRHTPEVRDWKAVETDWAIWPPVRFRAATTDLGNGNYRPPFHASKGDRGRHWLGTDRLGRDTLAGLISGARIAVVVGLGSLGIALLIGIPLGAIAGYFGNDGLRWPRYRSLGLVIGLFLGLAYGWAALWPATTERSLGLRWLLILLVAMGAVAVVTSLLRWLPGTRQSTKLPIDGVVLRLIELFTSIPGLVLLIALLSIISRPSIGLVVVVIGGISWTAIARFLRAELLRIRSLPYIEAAQVSGLPKARILFRHALPNAIGPVLVVAAFLVGFSILSEAMLSFLGVGVPTDQITWGSMLGQSRTHPSAWWLAVLPGVLLTLTVLACNRVAMR